MIKSLITKLEYDELTPYQQGFVIYMQAEVDGSELKGLHNPYPENTIYYDDWNRGNRWAMICAQDEED